MNLKFHMRHDQTPRLQNNKIELGRIFKMATVTKNSKTIKKKRNFLQNGYVSLAEILYEVLVGP